MEIFGYELEYFWQSILVSAFMLSLFWFLPEAIGVKGYSLMYKIIITAVTIPASFFIVPFMANR